MQEAEGHRGVRSWLCAVEGVEPARWVGNTAVSHYSSYVRYVPHPHVVGSKSWRTALECLGNGAVRVSLTLTYGITVKATIANFPSLEILQALCPARRSVIRADSEFGLNDFEHSTAYWLLPPI